MALIVILLIVAMVLFMWQITRVFIWRVINEAEQIQNEEPFECDISWRMLDYSSSIYCDHFESSKTKLQSKAP